MWISLNHSVQIIIFTKNCIECVPSHNIQTDVYIFSLEEGRDPERGVRTEFTDQTLSKCTCCLQWLKRYINEFSFSVTFYQEPINHSNYLSFITSSEMWSSLVLACCVCWAFFSVWQHSKQWNLASFIMFPLSSRCCTMKAVLQEVLFITTQIPVSVNKQLLQVENLPPAVL